MFMEEIGKHITPRESQGTYATYVAKSTRMRSTQGNPESAGLGLSMKQLIKVTQHMRTYISPNKKESVALAKAIDGAKGSSLSSTEIDYKADQRRYGSGQFRDVFESHRFWLDTFEHCFLYWALHEAETDDPQLTENLLRCLVYVSLASNVLARAKDHSTHRGNESPVLGLFTATIKHLYSNEFNVDEFTYQIFKTVKIEDVGLDEIITGVLSSAYPWDCGMNVAHCGGGTTPDRTGCGYLQGLAENARRIRESGIQEQNIKESADKIDRVAHLLAYRRSKDEDNGNAGLKPIQKELRHLEDALHFMK